MMYKTRQMYT